jgi:SAM-dependent methyltransferase
MFKMKWNPVVDNRPNVDSPRIKFSQSFSVGYSRRSNRVLDLGCGIGSYTFLIDRPGCLGIDLNIDALKVAKTFCPHSQFLVASGLHLPLKDQIFDSIFMWEIIEYIEKEKEEKLFEEIYRVLIPGANLLLSAPNRQFIYNILDPDYLLLRRQRHFRLKEVEDLLSEAGFTVKKTAIRGGWKTILAMNIFYFCKHVLRRRCRKIQRLLDKRSEEELISEKNGITNIFVAAKKSHGLENTTH